MIYTSLAEIKSFSPCGEGWRNILNGQGKTEADDVLFPLTEAVESNSISDVCWLLGRRKKEIEVCARFAAMCADSVKHLKNKNTVQAAAYAAYAADAAYAAYADADAAAAADAAAYAAYADAYAAADADAYAADAYAYAADAYAADAAADAAYAADAAAYAAFDEQKEKNKQFLIQCITEWKGE